MKEEHGFTGHLLIPDPSYFQKQPELGIQYFAYTGNDQSLVHLYVVNADSKEGIPAAIEKDKTLVEQELKKAVADQDVKTEFNLRNQLEAENGLLEMLSNPVFMKTPPQELLGKALEGLRDIKHKTGVGDGNLMALPAERVTFLNAISRFEKY